jgi:uncharacterized membrane protein YhaH (DUF805 family)
MDWMLMPLRRYAEFSGRSQRKEFWMFVLGYVIVAIVLNIVEGILGLSGMVGPYGPLTSLFMLAVFIPYLAVGARRLHDTNRSGWWLLLGLVPLIGIIVLIVFFASDGTSGDNQYCPDPKGTAPVQAFT